MTWWFKLKDIDIVVKRPYCEVGVYFLKRDI